MKRLMFEYFLNIITLNYSSRQRRKIYVSVYIECLYKPLGIMYNVKTPTHAG